MLEKSIGDRSKWHSYFQALPTMVKQNQIIIDYYFLFSKHEKISKQIQNELKVSPFLWSNEKLMNLQGCPLVDEVILQRNRLQEIFDAVMSAFSKQDEFKELLIGNENEFQILKEASKKFSLNSFLYMKAIVDSRAFFIRIGENIGTQLALVPFVDLLNHHENGQASFGKFEISTGTATNKNDDSDRVENGVFSMKALTEIKKGQQIFFSYGDYGNRELLLYYGFSIPNLSGDQVEISLEIEDENQTSTTQSEAEKKLAMKRKTAMRVLGLENWKTQLLKYGLNSIPLKLLWTICISTSTEQELNKIIIGSNPTLAFQEDTKRIAMKSLHEMLTNVSSNHSEILNSNKKKTGIVGEEEDQNIRNYLEGQLRILNWNLALIEKQFPQKKNQQHDSNNLNRNSKQSNSNSNNKRKRK